MRFIPNFERLEQILPLDGTISTDPPTSPIEVTMGIGDTPMAQPKPIPPLLMPGEGPIVIIDPYYVAGPPPPITAPPGSEPITITDPYYVEGPPPPTTPIGDFPPTVYPIV